MHMTETELKIYFAGDLFDSKDLGGNLMLAEAIAKISAGKYLPVLPQDGECEVKGRSSQTIRDCDFKKLLECDVIVANFDGTDLDSGTVVEFCFAKMLDIPAVLLRTDFRDCGDSTLPDGDPWNLMCSHFPRTKVLHINSMELYHQYLAKSGNRQILLECYYGEIAKRVITSLDSIISASPWLSQDELLSQYQRAIRSIGGHLDNLIPENVLKQIIRRKIAKRIY